MSFVFKSYKARNTSLKHCVKILDGNLSSHSNEQGRQFVTVLHTIFTCGLILIWVQLLANPTICNTEEKLQLSEQPLKSLSQSPCTKAYIIYKRELLALDQNLIRRILHITLICLVLSFSDPNIFFKLCIIRGKLQKANPMTAKENDREEERNRKMIVFQQQLINHPHILVPRSLKKRLNYGISEVSSLFLS